MIYFDNGATTFPKPLSVRKAINEAMSDYGANPGRSGHKMSVKSSEIMYSCRDNAAKLFGSENPENIIFTLNCTMALNTVIKGILKQGDHAVISSLEHNAVVRPLETLKKNKIEYSVAECDPYDNEQTIENFRKQFKSNTKLVICTHASNVFGIKLPIERIGALCRLNGILFCVDAAQSAGTADINLSDSCIDFLCTAGHKGLYGPMGTGLLIINSETTPDSLIQGGTGSDSANLNQPEILPDKYESGTPNLPGIAGLNAGIKFVLNKKTDRIYNSELSLARMLYKRLEKAENVILYTKMPEKSHSVPVISFNIKNTESETVAKILNDSYNIAVRAGLHCAPLAHKSFGTQDTGTVRAVVSAFTTKNDVVYFGNLTHKSGTVRHMGDNLTGDGDGDDEQILIELSRVPQEYDKIVIVVNIYSAVQRKQHFGMIRNAFIRIVDGSTNKEMCKYDLTENYSGMTAMIFGEIYRHNGEWKFGAIGQGTKDTSIGDLCRRYV